MSTWWFAAGTATAPVHAPGRDGEAWDTPPPVVEGMPEQVDPEASRATRPTWAGLGKKEYIRGGAARAGQTPPLTQLAVDNINDGLCYSAHFINDSRL